MNLDRIVTICTIIGALVILYGGVFIVGIIRGKNTQKKEKYLLYISYIMSISILTYCMLTLNNYGYSQLDGRIIWFASMIILLCVLPFWIKNLHIIIMIIHKKFSNMIFNIEKTELVFSLMSFVLELIFLTISFSSGKIISMLTRPTDKSFGNNELIMCLLGWIIILLSILWIYNIIKYILLSTNENNSQENKLKNVFIYKTNKIEVELNSDTHKTYSDVIIFIRINIIKRLFSKAEKKNIYTFALKHSPLDFFLISSDDTYKTIDDKRKEIIKYIIDMLFSPLPDNVINILELYDTVFYNKSSRSIKFQEKYLREEYQKLEKELSRKREELSFLQHKINTITEFLDNVDTITSDDISQLYNISNEREIRSEEIVQDIYHLTKTPLRTVLGALNSLNITKNECDNSSEEIIEIIRKQVSLIEIILDGYRQILVDDPELKTLCNIPQFLKSSAESTAKLGNKNIVCLIDSFPEKICDQGNSYAILLLKPLIDNAIEASPDGNNIYVRVTENQNEFIVTVENKCTVIPNQNDLYTQGFTTKENGGRGLSSVRMLAKKTNYYFKISVDDETDTVIAEIRFPKS